jgi:hypothetical protein
VEHREDLHELQEHDQPPADQLQGEGPPVGSLSGQRRPNQHRADATEAIAATESAPPSIAAAITAITTAIGCTKPRGLPGWGRPPAVPQVSAFFHVQGDRQARRTLVLDAGGLSALARRRARLAELRLRGHWPARVPAVVPAEALTGDRRRDFHANRLHRASQVRDVTAPAAMSVGLRP